MPFALEIMYLQSPYKISISVFHLSSFISVTIPCTSQLHSCHALISQSEITVSKFVYPTLNRNGAVPTSGLCQTTMPVSCITDNSVALIQGALQQHYNETRLHKWSISVICLYPTVKQKTD